MKPGSMKRHAPALLLAACALLSTGCVKSIGGGGSLGPAVWGNLEMADTPTPSADQEIRIHVEHTDGIQSHGGWATDGVQRDGLRQEAGSR